MELGRKTPPRRGAKERIHDYLEIYAEPPEEAIRAQAGRCMDCGVPFCNSGCPLGNIIPDWNDLVYRGKWREALERLHRTNNFPEFTGRICPAPCESACVLGINDDPVTIEFIEKTIAERGFAEGWVTPEPPARRSGRKVAVVGSGPAGMAAAQQLNRAGHEVDAVREAGPDRRPAALRHSRLQAREVDHRPPARADDRRGRAGPHRRARRASDISGPELLREFDAVLLTGGAESPRDLKVPGRELEGVHFAMPFLEQQNRRVAGDARLRRARDPRDGQERARAGRRRHRLRLHRHQPPPGREARLQLRAARAPARGRARATRRGRCTRARRRSCAPRARTRRAARATGASRPSRSPARTAGSRSCTRPARALRRARRERPARHGDRAGQRVRARRRPGAAGDGLPGPGPGRHAETVRCGADRARQRRHARLRHDACRASTRRATCAAASRSWSGRSPRAARPPRRSIGTSPRRLASLSP